jgi:hypothetical protein
VLLGALLNKGEDMKATVRIEKEVDIKAVLIDIAPRYIGDRDDDDMPTDFPLLSENKDAWRASVNIDTGEIANWPIGDARKMHVKVCDAGIYKLIDVDGNIVAEKDGYVPDVVPNDYGDYVVLNINENGVIDNWNSNASIDDFFDA